MTDDIFFEIHQGLPREGPGRNEYTKKAFEMLPRLDNPRILDIGCGTGGPPPPYGIFDIPLVHYSPAKGR